MTTTTSTSSATDNNNNNRQGGDGWMRLERTVRHVGKLQPASKRRVEWVLRYDDDGASPWIVRVVLTWSCKTGKYTVHVNDREEVFDRLRSGATSLLDHSWTTYRDDDDDGDRRQVNFRIVAARTVPTKTPFVQYELLVDGVSFQRLFGDVSDLSDEGLPSLAQVMVTSR